MTDLPVKKICVVEDCDSLRESLVDSLTLYGFSAQGFWNGAEAWQAIQAQPFDLVLSDVDMPEMDGLQLLAHVLSRQDALPLVFVTGKTQYRHAPPQGAQGVVFKPFDVDDIINEVCRVLAIPLTAMSCGTTTK
jgi:DNA-binding NtrC family response regulator